MQRILALLVPTTRHATHDGRPRRRAPGWAAAIGLLLAPTAHGQRAPDFLYGDQNQSWFGAAVAGAGDVNGDGYDDIIVGAPYRSNLYPGGSYEDMGAVALYLGSAVGIVSTPAWYVVGSGNANGVYCGRDVAGAGDVNGDGFDDVLIYRRKWRPPTAELYHGSPSGLSPTPAWVGVSPHGNDDLSMVSEIGDVNADGYDDIVVVARGNYHGEAYAFHGSPSGLGPLPAWSLERKDLYSVERAGDVNGDGYDDVVTSHVPRTDPGYYAIVLGSPSGLAETPIGVYGVSDAGPIGPVHAAGDVNGDGYGDLLSVGPGAGGNGEVRLYPGSPTGPMDIAWVIQGTPTVPISTAGYAGDVDADGFDDLLIGCGYAYDNRGAVFLVRGSAALSVGPLERVAKGTRGVFLGLYPKEISAAGDVDGDGYPEILIGAPYYAAHHLGGVGLFYGP